MSRAGGAEAAGARSPESNSPEHSVLSGLQHQRRLVVDVGSVRGVTDARHVTEARVVRPAGPAAAAAAAWDGRTGQSSVHGNTSVHREHTDDTGHCALTRAQAADTSEAAQSHIRPLLIEP